MNFSDTALWGAAILFIFFALYIVGTWIRNNAAKKDQVNRSEKDTLVDSVSIKPRHQTRKID